ncbi:MAG: hypothetical protein HY705_03830 [Gemmatimonadetes bacterium]|nr:hypothetical protein [Gemmatimonadota bacterium]
MPGRPVVEGMPAEGGSFNRDHDTLHIRWSGGAGTKGVFVQVRPRDIHRRITFLVFTDSTQFRIPGNLPLPFLSDTLPHPAGEASRAGRRLRERGTDLGHGARSGRRRAGSVHAHASALAGFRQMMGYTFGPGERMLACARVGW